MFCWFRISKEVVSWDWNDDPRPSHSLLHSLLFFGSHWSLHSPLPLFGHCLLGSNYDCFAKSYFRTSSRVHWLGIILRFSFPISTADWDSYNQTCQTRVYLHCYWRLNQLASLFYENLCAFTLPLILHALKRWERWLSKLAENDALLVVSCLHW